MTDETLSLAQLDDERDTVYVVGVAQTHPPSVHEWMNDDDGFHALWNETFDYAEVLVVPGMTGITEVQQTTQDDLKTMLESVDRGTDE